MSDKISQQIWLQTMKERILQWAKRFSGGKGHRNVTSGVEGSLTIETAPSKSKCPVHANSSPHLSFADIPGPQPSVPFLGTAWQYFPGGRYDLFKLHEANRDKYHRYGTVVKEEYQWRSPMVQIFDPQDFETVFRHQGRYPSRPVNQFLTHYRKLNPHKYDSPGLANSVGEEWLRLRNILAPVLKKLKDVDMILSDANHISNGMVTLIRHLRHPDDNHIVDIQNLLYRVAVESIFRMCLDTELGCLKPTLHPSSDANAMIVAVQKMFQAYQKLYYGIPLWKYFRTPAFKLLDEVESTIYEITSQYIDKAVRHNHHLGEDRILRTILKIDDLTEKERNITIIDFISGGIFTVTNSLCFVLYHLARNPQVQDKIYQELQQCSFEGNLTNQAVSEMHYLRASVKEAFRLSPTVPGIIRILPDDVVLSNYSIPAGTAIFCHFMVTCQLAKYFHKPQEYLPERWLTGSRPVHPFAMLPFGHGSRMCAGKRFAMMEIYSVVAKLVSNFKLQCPMKNLDMSHNFIVVPTQPILITFQDR